MLEAVRLRNFQCHEKLDVVLDPHLTVVVGSSDVGKSAILRALRWVCFNRPDGSEFIGWGRTLASVRLKIDDRTVSRTKGKGNQYKLDGNTFSAVGRGVPEEVSNLLNVDEVNFQNQLESPFWFLKSPGEVSRELNRVVNLDLIDRVLGHVSSELRKTRTTVEVSENRLSQAREKRDNLKWVVEADVCLKRLEDKERDLAEKARRIAYAESVLEKGEQTLQESQNVVNAKRGALKLGLLLDSLEEKGNRLETMRVLLTRMEQLEGELCQADSSIQTLRRELEEKSQGLCPICQGPLPPTLPS